MYYNICKKFYLNLKNINEKIILYVDENYFGVPFYLVLLVLMAKYLFC